jgi:hypothetical protein
MFGRELSLSTDSRKMVAGAEGGNTVGSNVIVSPLSASNNACRNVPGPLSSLLVTTMVPPKSLGTIKAASRTRTTADTEMKISVLFTAVLISQKRGGVRLVFHQ